METIQNSKFKLHTASSAPEASQETLEMAEKRFGFIPNVLGQLAESPSAIQADMQLLGFFDQSSLAVEEQWIVLLVVSTQCKADYCVAANSTVAQMLGVPAEVVQAVRKRKALTDPKLEAIRVFTEEMVQNRGVVSKQTQDRFFEAGFTTQQVYDVILGIALETVASYTAHIASTPVDEQFQANV